MILVGTIYSEDVVYCPKCGAKLEHEYIKGEHRAKCTKCYKTYYFGLEPCPC